MLHPLQINHPGALVKRRVTEDVVVGISDEIRPGRPAKARVMQSFGLYGRMVKDGAAAFEERADVVGEPESRENRAHWTGESRGQMVLRDHERDVFRHAIVSPDLQNMFRQLRLFVE